MMRVCTIDSSAASLFTVSLKALVTLEYFESFSPSVSMRHVSSSFCRSSNSAPT